MTFNKVVVPNIPKALGADTDEAWAHVWGLSRALKKAGWKLLASGDSFSKDTSKDPARDLWCPSENVAATQVWQVDDSGGPSFVDMTTEFNDATTGDIVPFPATDAVDDYFAIAFSAPFGGIQLDRIGGTFGSTGTLVWEYWDGAAWSALLNVVDTSGHFKLALVNGDTVSWSIPTDWASTTVNAVAGFYIRARITLAFGTNPVMSQGFVVKPDEDEGTTGNTGIAASIGAISEGRCTITGLTGMTNASKGNFLILSGAASAINNNMHQIEEVLGASSVRVDARNFVMVAADGNNPNISWDEIDPTNETYPTRLDDTGGWTVWQGPSILKIPISVEPVDGASGFNFLRGENVVQASTSAEGEILGWVFDGVSVGYLVVSPRVIGTGGDTPYGWDTGNTITGDVSSATVDQDGTALEYRHQMVLGKHSADFTYDLRGHWYMQSFEPVGEASEDFHTKAESTGCSPSLQPCGGGAGNGFPTYAWVVCGRATTTGSNWHGSNSSFPLGNGHAICMDILWESGQSADGTVILIMAHTGGYYGCRAFLRLDDTEPGDLTPFASFGISQGALYDDAARIVASQSTGILSTNYMNTIIQDTQSTAHSNFKTWRRRGFNDANDKYQSCEMLVQIALSSQSSHIPAIEEDQGTGENLQTSLVPTRMREPVRIGSVDAAHGKMRKGTVRHMTLVQGGIAGQTYDSGKFIQLSPTAGAFVVPWDETTLPETT